MLLCSIIDVMDLRFRLALPKHLMSSDITDHLFLRAINNPSPHFGMDELSSLPGYDVEQERFQRLLRSYVDQWIDTGVFEDGTEDLTERGRLNDRWFKQGQLLPYALPKSTALVDAYTIVLEVFRQTAQTLLSEDGLQVVFPTYEAKLADAPLDSLAEREAKHFYVWFLASDLRVKLGKCRACDRYEIKTRKFYKRGTYCRRCKAKTSAGEITLKKRQDLQEKRKEALGAVLECWKVRIDLIDLAMRKRLAEEVNRRLKGEGRISSKWVKRNLV
jgi:hypothetical protein